MARLRDARSGWLLVANGVQFRNCERVKRLALSRPSFSLDRLDKITNFEALVSPPFSIRLSTPPAQDHREKPLLAGSMGAEIEVVESRTELFVNPIYVPY